jgi:glycosyltransferase involved in cell wall biosynthesis
MTFGLHVPGYIRRVLNPQGFQVAVEDLNKVPLFLHAWASAPVVLLVHHLFGTTAFKEASFPVAAATWLLERPIPMAYRGVPVLTVSKSTSEDLFERGLRGEAAAVIHNGVYLDRLAPGPEGGRFESPTILYLGRLKRYKGVDLLIRAVGYLKETGDLSVRLLVAGKGDDEPRLRSLATSLGVGDLVRFLGYVSEEEKVELFQRAWIHALTSPKEGWGISILEAAACGTPTVASRSPGLRDAVLDGETGVLVPHGNVKDLAESLERLLKADETRRMMGRAARRFAEGFTWEASARKMEAFLSDRVAAIRSQG